MKLAFSTLACPGWSVQQVADAARSLGYEGVELRLLDGEVIDPLRDREAIIGAARVIRVGGVEVCAFDTSCTFNHPDAGERARQVDVLRGWIRLAAELDVPVLRVFGGPGQSESMADQETENGWVAEALRSVALEAEAAGVTLALETHDAFSSASRVAAVLDAVASPAAGALWDSHHPYRMGESAGDVVDVLGDRIAHVHVKDARRADDGWQLVLIGEGEVPIRGQLQHLQQIDYGGWVSVEWEKKWHPELPEPEVALPQHIAWLREVIGGTDVRLC